MDALRPISPVAPSAVPLRSVTQPVAASPADTLEAGRAPAPGRPTAPAAAEPSEKVRATLYRQGPDGATEALRMYECEGQPVPVRDAQGRLSFVLTAPEGERTRVRRVASDGEEKLSLLVDGKVQVDPEGGRIYNLHQGRVEARHLEDGHQVASLDVGPGRSSLLARPGGGVYVQGEGSLRVLDADLEVVRDVKHPVQGHVAELAGGALALQDWQTGKLAVLDAQGQERCSLDRVSRTQVGPDGALWGVHQEEVVRIDPGTGAVRRLPGARGFLEGLHPRPDGSYLVHRKPDLTRFDLHLFSPDGVETETFEGKGSVEMLQLSPDGSTAYGMVSRWQDEPPFTLLERFDLEKPQRGGLLGLFRGSGEGHPLFRTDFPEPGARQHFVPMPLSGGRVAVATPTEGVLLDREGSILERFASAEEMRPMLEPLSVTPHGLWEPRTVDPDTYLRAQARIHCNELPAGFGRSQGAFPAVGGVQFSRAAEMPTSSEDVGTVDLARLFESNDLPERLAFPVGAGSVALERSQQEGDRLVVEVPDPKNPGGMVRKTYWLEEFEQYTRIFPVSTDRGQYVVAADDRDRAWWLDPAGGGDRRFELPGALGARVFSEHALTVTGKDGSTLVLELPAERILREPRPGSQDDPDAPRIVTSETEVRLGGVTLPVRQ